MNFLKSRPRLNYWLLFTAKTLFYFGILLALIYLYHYKNILGGITSFRGMKDGFYH